MNLRQCRHALLLSATLTLGLWVGQAEAAQSFNAAQTQFESTGATIELARRRRFSLGSRSSRYRVGGFRRGGSCLASDQGMSPIVPPLAGEGIESSDVPVDVTTEALPTFFVHVPQLAEPTPVMFTLQNEAGTEEIAAITFELSGEAGIIGIQPTELSQGLNPGEAYYWQMAIQCSADSPDENPIVSGWITRLEKTEDLEGSTFEQAAILVEMGIWQDAVTLLAQARLDAPDEATKALADEDWQVMMDEVGLSDFANVPILGIMQK